VLINQVYVKCDGGYVEDVKTNVLTEILKIFNETGLSSYLPVEFVMID